MDIIERFLAMHRKTRLLHLYTCLLSLAPFIQGCSVASQNYDYSYLNNQYFLSRAGDIHGVDPFSETTLSNIKGFTDYISLFNKKESLLNFQCYGTSVEDFYCIGSVKIVDAMDNVLLNNSSFECWANVDLYYGEVKFINIQDAEQIGRIYIHTPYWCRLQLDYDVDGSGNKTTITFEFGKGRFNDLPEFLNE